LMQSSGFVPIAGKACQINNYFFDTIDNILTCRPR
jgi:hypothetical protein